MFDDELEFPSDDEVFKRPTEDVEAIVAIRAEKDENGNLKERGDFQTGEGKWGRWVRLPFEIVDGEYRGVYCSMFLPLDPKKQRFRSVYTQATGVDLSSGASGSINDLVQGLLSKQFKAVVGPDKKNPEQYTQVRRLLEAAGAYEAPAPEASGADVSVSEDGDDDIPF